jgi:hypothetical protein
MRGFLTNWDQPRFEKTAGDTGIRTLLQRSDREGRVSWRGIRRPLEILSRMQKKKKRRRTGVEN